MYGVRKCSSFILLQVVDQFSQHHLLWEDLDGAGGEGGGRGDRDGEYM